MFENKHRVFLQKTVSDSEMGIFTRQFAVMLDSGMQSTEVLNVLSENRKNKYFGRCISATSDSIRKGKSFSQAASDYPNVFSPLFIAMISAGEKSGNMTAMLDHLTKYYEEQAEIKNKIVQALLYPLIVFCVALGVVVFLIGYVVPIFIEVLQNLNAELPVSTKILMMIGRWIGNIIPLLSILVLMLILLKTMLKNHRDLREKIDRTILKIPFYGRFQYSSECIRLSVVIERMIAAGVPLLNSLDACRDVLKNYHLKKAVTEIKNTVQKGESLADGFNKSMAFDSEFCQMIRIGEGSGTLEKSLEKIQIYYKKDLERRLKRLSVCLEPMMLLIVGLMVLFLVLSVMSPIYSIYENYAITF